MLPLPVVAGGVAVVVAAALTHRDAARVGVDTGSPPLWAALVALTGGLGLITSLIVPDAPVPGVLVLFVLGPILYLLERDDARHGDEPADPTRLPTAGGGGDDESDVDGGSGDADPNADDAAE